MEQELKRETTVTSHRNPDTDFICSAICYTNLKQTITGDAYIPTRTDHAGGETRFALDYFGTEEPKLVENVRAQVKDIEIRKTRGVADNILLKKAWNIVQENNVMTIPSVKPDGALEGLIAMGDITKTYMNIYDSSILSKTHTQYSNIIETLEADIVMGNTGAYFDREKALVAATNPDLMEFYTEPHDLVILGNRYKSQLCAIGMGADCIIVCEGAGVSMTIKEIAQDRGYTVIATTYDACTAVRLINQSMPISYFMTREHLIAFNSDDHTDEIREVMASKRHRDFPILDKERRYLEMISRRNSLSAKNKQVILVDHNEKSRVAADIESAEVMEIIDHHRLGTVQTMIPVFFHNQPLGCTATIIYQMYLENKVGIEPKIARLLYSAIVSDTLSFRSLTYTPVDEMAARSLAAVAGLDVEKCAIEIFGVGGNLKDRSDEEIFYQDFKKFPVDRALTDVGQATSLNDVELGTLKEKVLGYMERIRESNSLDVTSSVLTDILKESTDLTCYGQDAVQLAAKTFHLGMEETAKKPGPVLSLLGVVSRKEQLIPELMLTEQDQARQGQEDRVMSKEYWEPGNILYSVPAIMIGCGREGETPNVIIVAQTGTICSDLAMVSTSARKERFSHNTIRDTGEFVINLMNKRPIRAADCCGVKSSGDVDKLKETRLTPQVSRYIKAPGVEESPVNIGRKVVEVKELRSHDMSIAKVIRVTIDSRCMGDRGKFNLDMSGLVSCSHGEYFELGRKLRGFGYSMRKPVRRQNDRDRTSRRRKA